MCLVSFSCIDNQSNNAVIVSADWLQAKMKDPKLVLFHVGTKEVYDSIHIDGSLFLDPSNFVVSSDGLRNQLPEPGRLWLLLDSLGVEKNSDLVLYSESERQLTRTARVFLTLDYAGYGDQCHVLNGGLDGWLERNERPGLSQERKNTTVPGENRETAERPDDLQAKAVTITAEQLNQHRWDPEYVIMDVRSAGEYFGQIDSSGQVGTRGHVEGAYFMDYHFLLDDSEPQFIKNDEELLKEFKKAGMDRRKTAVFYCGSGVRASLSYLVARHLNYPALLFDGSYQEWEQLGLPLTSPVIESSIR